MAPAPFPGQASAHRSGARREATVHVWAEVSDRSHSSGISSTWFIPIFREVAYPDGSQDSPCGQAWILFGYTHGMNRLWAGTQGDYSENFPVP